MKILPITHINIEDISAVTKKNCKKWNSSFSPLEVGKIWFYNEVKKFNVKLILTKGYDTKKWRDAAGYKKTTKKLDNVWEAHNVDSHSLAEIIIGTVKPFLGIHQFSYLSFYRRQLHVANPIKGNKRKQYGTTRSLGLNRGTLVKHKKYGFCYVGGSSKGKISLHNIGDKKRISQSIDINDCKIKSNMRWRFRYIVNGQVAINNFW